MKFRECALKNKLTTPFCQPELLEDFTKQNLSFVGKTHAVYVSGEGPAVIIMAEMPGIYYHVAQFARKVRDAGFTVWMPHLFGEAGRAPTVAYGVATAARACINAEFRVFAANRSSPVVDWLRALAAHAHPICGGKGVGSIGMCFTGNFALSLMLEPSVLAPVLSQPSLPLLQKGGMHISPDELEVISNRLQEEDLTVLAYRFEGDSLCRPERFEDYQNALGDRFQARVLPDSAAATGAPIAAHSVVTLHLIDEEGEPTRAAVDEILSFYKMRLI